VYSFSLCLYMFPWMFIDWQWFWWVFVDVRFSKFHWSLLILIDFNEFLIIVIDSNWFQLIFLHLLCVSSTFIDLFHWVSLTYTDFHWRLLIFGDVRCFCLLIFIVVINVHWFPLLFTAFDGFVHDFSWIYIDVHCFHGFAMSFIDFNLLSTMFVDLRFVQISICSVFYWLSLFFMHVH
jgi:hypothetical protein